MTDPNRPSLDELNSGEIGQALSRRIVRTMYRKLEEAGASGGGMWTANFEIKGDYDRLSLIAFPAVADMLDHAIIWDSEGGSWQRSGGLDYEVYVRNDLIKINRVAMVPVPKETRQLPENYENMPREEIDRVLASQVHDYAKKNIEARRQAEEQGLSRVDRGEAKDLLKIIRTAEPIY